MNNYFHVWEQVGIVVYRSKGKGRRKKLKLCMRQRLQRRTIHLKGKKDEWWKTRDLFNAEQVYQEIRRM